MSAESIGKDSREGGVSQEIQSDEKFSRILDTAILKNPELGEVLKILEIDIKKGLIGEKGINLELFLSEPQVFQNNPEQYRKLFETLGTRLDRDGVKLLKEKSLVIYAEYSDYTGEQLKRTRDSNIQSVTTGMSEIANKGEVRLNNTLPKIAEISQKISEISQKNTRLNDTLDTRLNDTITAARESFQKKLEKMEEVNSNIRNILPPGEQQGIDQFVRNNQNLITNSPNESIRSLSDERNKNIYLESLYYLQFGGEIRQRISEQYRGNPSKQMRVLKEFDENIGQLKQLDIIRPEYSVSKAFEGNFPPTRSTETARVQAEKYEKTHDVYRDGTSLYFVNKNDPKDIKKIEIYADRAVLTVMQGGLSLSRDMTLLSREETEERKDIRKAEGISQEKSREVATIGGAFFQMRGGEYTTIPGGDRNIVDILKSRPSRSIQEQYEDYEQLLATKSSEELAKESDASKQSKGAIIDRMLDLSGELYRDNQQYFALGAFGEEKILNEADQVKNKLEQRISGLKIFKNSIYASEKVSSDLTKLKGAFNPGDKIDTNPWEERVRGYLKEITGDRIGLDGLSDSQFQQLIYQLKQRDRTSGIWKDGVELGIDTVRREHQLRELEGIARKIQIDGSTRTGWQGLSQKINQEGTPENTAWRGHKEQFESWLKNINTPSEAK